MIKIKVINNITTKRQSDGTEFRRFTAVNESNELCIVYMGRYRREKRNVSVGNYLLLTDVVVTHRPDIVFISLGVISKIFITSAFVLDNSTEQKYLNLPSQNCISFLHS